MQLSFSELLLKTRGGRSGNSLDAPLGLLALDPGLTTGWAFFERGILKKCGQCPGDDIRLEQLIDLLKPTHVAMEEYVLYPWASKQQAWSDFPVPQLIGVIKFVCRKRKIKVYMQGANLGKGFCTDAKLRSWNYYIVGKKHANDAIRHGCYWLLFGKS